MSRIAYDPVKDRFATIIRNSRGLRTLFYGLLDLFFLRSWYVRRILKKHASALDDQGPWKLLDAGSGFGQYDRFILRQFSNVKVRAVDVKADYLDDCRHYFRREDRKSTRLNSSHVAISYAVFCFKKNKKIRQVS